ncbi:hypothetical protein O181_071909 [Austropuccinia psidii MF-1]|uniref:Uncharacterized protein n=1 Tax=Austropuccinia psidii MF-1 TaxID=1389203 RepID=A0A9Q3IAY8_9BASI|nr:hypothetical protein [Austropuccinia psidii MF-1]
MASSGHFDPSQTYDGYRAVEVIDPACSECLAKGGIYGVEKMGLLGESSQYLRHLLLMELQDFLNRDVARWINVGGPIAVGGRPIYSSSEVPISRINTEGVVKRIRSIAVSPTDPDAEGSDELDGEEVKVVPHLLAIHPEIPLLSLLPSDSQYSQNLPTSSFFHSYYNSSFFTKYFPCQACLESSSKTITKPETQELTHNHLLSTPTCGQFQHRRDGLSPLSFPAAQVFQRRDCWPIQITREDPNAVSENQEAVARLFRRVDRNSRDVIMYANDRMIVGTASEEMAANFARYEDELINDLQRTFNDLGRYN